MRKKYPKLLKKEEDAIKCPTLYYAMLNSELSQPQIAEKVGVSTRTVQRWLYANQKPLPEHAVVLKELFPELEIESIMYTRE